MQKSKRICGRKPTKRKGGFTLVEVSVAVLLVGLVLAGTFGALTGSFRLIEDARDSTRIAQIMQSELEDLRTLSYDEVSALPAESTYTPKSSFSASFGGKYTCVRKISTRATDQLALRIYVKWTTGSGRAREDFFETWYTKGGFNDYYYKSF